MKRAMIVGICEGPLDAEARPCVDIAAACARGALQDAQLSMGDLDGVLAAYSWEEPSLMFASELASRLARTPRYVETVCFGGASSAMMVARAARAIESGIADVVVAAAASNRTSKLGRSRAIAALRDVLSPEFDIPYGAFIPPIYALTAARFLHEGRATQRQLAAVAVMQRRHAQLHPGAAKTSPLSIDDVLASPMIASPLHLLDCCLVTDFGGAVVLTSQERARTLDVPGVAVLGTGEAHDRVGTVDVHDLTSRGARLSGSRAFASSGLTPDDVDVAEVYDSFTITVLHTLEDLGLAQMGRAGALVEDGAFAIGGRLPLNTNGGMLSYRTGGISHVIEAVDQLRGTAGARQVAGASVALAHGIGGALSSHCTLLLGV